MPQRKKMETPSKQPKSSTMTHEEEEEMEHDISKLRNQVQQIYVSQKVKKNELEAMANVKIDGIKMGMIVSSDGLKEDMEAMVNVKIERLNEDLVKLVEERLPSGDKVI